MADPTQELRFLSLTTTLGTDVLVIGRMSGEDRLGSPFEFRISAASKWDQFDVDQLVGTKVSVRMDTAVLKGKGLPHRFFSGIVSQVDHVGFDLHGLSQYVLTVVPWLWLLTRTSDCRIFQTLTVPEIIKKVFEDFPNADYRFDLKGEYPEREYCVQYRETDFNFVQRLMEHEGIYYFWEHREDAHTMVICDHMSSHQPLDGFEEVRYRAEEAGIQEKFILSRWQAQHRVTPGKYEMNSYDFKTPNPSPNTKLLGRSVKKHAYAEGGHEIYDNPGDYTGRPDGERLAVIRREEIQCHTRTIEARTTARGLFTGCLFTSRDVPKKNQNANHLIISSTFIISAGNYGSSMGTDEDTYECDLTGIRADGVFRPERVARATRVEGPQTAIVSGPKKEEIWVDEFGRVKVQFLWDRYGEFDAGSSCWIRVSQAWAGKGWGGMAIPRIGQEVIVEFLEGDPDRPIITGRVYNGDHPVPYKLPEHATRTTLKSRSSPDGGTGHNELRFEDKKGGEQVYIHAQKDMDVRIRGTFKETNYGARHERIGWRNDEGHGGSHFVTIHEDENTHVEEKHYEMVDNDSHLTVKGELTEKFEKSRKTHIGEKHVLNAAESIIETSDAISLTTGLLKMKGSNGVHVIGQQIVLEGTSLCFKSGGNFISINATGVQIQGTMVQINSGGSAVPAQEPAALPEISVLEPYDAKVADDSKGGGKHGYSGGTKPRGGGPVTPHKAPPYTPPPADKLPLVQPPTTNPPPGPIVCGGPYTLKDKQGRKGNGLLIEVVPESKFGGDTLTVSSEKACSCAGAKVKVGASETALNAPSKVDGWLIGDEPFKLIRTLGGASPKIVPLALTCGRDQSNIGSGEGKVYPSDKLEIKVELKELCKKCPAVDKAITGVAGALSKLTGKNIDPYDGVSFDAGLGRITIGTPTISLAYEAQWKEYPVGHAQEWQAYYAWKAGVGVSIAAEFKLDLLALGLTATGIGAGVVTLFNKVKSALGQDDPLIYMGFKVEIGGGGSIGYEEKAFGALEIKGTGYVSIGAGVNTSVVEATCEASTSVSSMVEGRVSKTGLKVSYEFCKWGGVQGKASMKLKIGKIFTVGYERSVQLIEGAGPLSSGSLGD